MASIDGLHEIAVDGFLMVDPLSLQALQIFQVSALICIDPNVSWVLGWTDLIESVFGCPGREEVPGTSWILIKSLIPEDHFVNLLALYLLQDIYTQLYLYLYIYII